MGTTTPHEELDQLERILRSLHAKVPGYPYELALIARMSATLEKRMAEVVNAALKPLELTSVLYHSLMIIYGNENGVMAPSEIANLTGERPNNVTHICNHLEKVGYISRAHAADDRRRLNISLTPAGRRILSKAQPLVWEAWRQRFKSLAAAELELLPQLLRHQIEGLNSIGTGEPG